MKTELYAPLVRENSRIQSIDILRGLVMVIMALDHVRDFWSQTPYRPEDLTQTSSLLFLTRWVTHLCAPTFMFLAGCSTFMYQERLGSRRAVSIFLLTRGLWLIFIEIFVISFILTHSYQIIVLEVIWALGCSMILLSALIWLPRWVLGVLAAILIVSHNAWPFIQPVTPVNLLLAILHNFPFFWSTPPTLISYPIVPWVAVMAMGYLAARWFTYDAQRSDDLFRLTGIGLLVLFVGLRLFNIYGDPFGWSLQERGWVYTLWSFVNITKYPPSLLFLFLTIGVALLLLPMVRNGMNPVWQWLSVIGQVPFFFFVVHLALISLGSYLWTLLSFGKGINIPFTPPANWPSDYEPHLGRAYLVWAVVVIALYFPCRRFSEYKKQNKSWWLSYL